MRLAPGLLRLKLHLASNGRRVVAVLLVLAAAALGGAGLAYADPPTEVVTEERHQQTVAADLQTSAVVTGDTDLYERGSRLEGKPIYLSEATPTLTVQVRTSLPEGSTGPVTSRLWVSHTARHDGEPFWRDRRTLVTETVRSPEGQVATETEVRMDEIRTRRARLRDEIGGIGELSTTLHARVEYDTGRYEGNLSISAPLGFTGRAYRLEGETADERTHATTVRTRTVEEGRALTVALPLVGQLAVPHLSALLGGIGGACLAGAVWIRLFLRRDPDEATLATALHRARYAEWISTGQLPPDVRDRSVCVDSLEGLVDVAIDSSKRVINDPDRDLYAVLDGDTGYYYDPKVAGESDPFVRKPLVDGREHDR